MTQRDGMGREVGGGFRIGNMCTPMADSCWCMAKPIQYCKVISLQLKWIKILINKFFKKESWVLKNWCFLTVVLEKTLESPLDYKDIEPGSPTGNQSWLFIRRSNAEAEAPVLWPPDAKNWLIGKDPDAGKDWSQEEKEMTEDEMVEWHHWLTGHESE